MSTAPEEMMIFNMIRYILYLLCLLNSTIEAEPKKEYERYFITKYSLKLFKLKTTKAYSKPSLIQWGGGRKDSGVLEHSTFKGNKYNKSKCVICSYF